MTTNASPNGAEPQAVQTTSPWKNTGTQSVVPVSLTDIMSEQLVSELSFKQPDMSVQETQETSSSMVDADDDEAKPTTAAGECDDDLMLAMLLQREFDREYDEMVKLRERKINANEKVSVSFEKYRLNHPEEESDSESEDEDLREFETSRKYNRQDPKFGHSGLTTHDGRVISKHDKEVSARKNTGRVLQFPPEFMTGDAAGMDVQLSNKVFNSLRTHSTAEQKRLARVRDKTDHATSELAMDAKTRLILFKMVDSGLLDSIGGQIATGKESTVLHAYGCRDPDNEVEVPNECAIKIFKTTLSEFKNRIDYVKDDYRFRNPRKLLKFWADKERLNLNRMCRSGIPCPRVVKMKNHVLVLSFIGDEGKPAPKLKNAVLDELELSDAYEQCVKIMTRMYVQCRLVHADLSEYNILYYKGQCYFIDVSQAVDLSHPRSLIFLAKDCMNLRTFFSRQGLVDLPSVRELFNQITGLSLPSDETFVADLDDFLSENRRRELRDDKKNPADADLKKHFESERYEEDEELAEMLLQEERELFARRFLTSGNDLLGDQATASGSEKTK